MTACQTNCGIATQWHAALETEQIDVTTDNILLHGWTQKHCSEQTKPGKTDYHFIYVTLEKMQTNL